MSNVIEKYASKGTTVFVQGFPIIEEYEKDGQKNRSFKVKLAGAGSTFRLASKGTSSPDAPQTGSPNTMDDDIPF